MRQPYPTDLPDEQWQVVQPLLPSANPGGRPRPVERREGVNTLLSQHRTGGPWDMWPHDWRPTSTVYDDFRPWRDDGTWPHLLEALREGVRQQAGRPPAPSAGSLDRQTGKGPEVGGERGDDGTKQVKGRTRPILVDALGLWLALVVTAAAADDGTVAPHVLATRDGHTHPRLERRWADPQDQNRTWDRWLAQQPVGYQSAVVERPIGATGFLL